MVRIAIVGLGYMGQIHLEAYKTIKNARVVAACDSRISANNEFISSVEGNLKSIKSDFSSLELYSDLKKMLDKGGFEVLDICLPTFLHTDVALVALGKGYHVFVEKPLALTVSDSLKIMRCAEEAKRKVGVGHCIRFWPSYVELRRIILDGDLGKIHSASFERYTPAPNWSTDGWLLSIKHSGGPLIDLHIHDSDFILSVFGMPDSVLTTGNKLSDPSIVQTLYRYKDISVYAAGGFFKADTFPFTMRSTCIFENGIVELDESKNPVLQIHKTGSDKKIPSLSTDDAYARELEDFVNSIENDTLTTVITPQSAVDAMVIVSAEKRSLEEGKEIIIKRELI